MECFGSLELLMIFFQLIISCFEKILQFQAGNICKWENVHLQKYVIFYQVINIKKILNVIVKSKNVLIMISKAIIRNNLKQKAR